MRSIAGSTAWRRRARKAPDARRYARTRADGIGRRAARRSDGRGAGPAARHLARARDRADHRADRQILGRAWRSEEHTSELQSLMRISYAVFCLKKKKIHSNYTHQLTINVHITK